MKRNTSNLNALQDERFSITDCEYEKGEISKFSVHWKDYYALNGLRRKAVWQGPVEKGPSGIIRVFFDYSSISSWMCFMCFLSLDSNCNSQLRRKKDENWFSRTRWKMVHNNKWTQFIWNISSYYFIPTLEEAPYVIFTYVSVWRKSLLGLNFALNWVLFWKKRRVLDYYFNFIIILEPLLSLVSLFLNCFVKYNGRFYSNCLCRTYCQVFQKRNFISISFTVIGCL